MAQRCSLSATGPADRLVGLVVPGSEQGNPYSHHVTGLHSVVDLNTMTLLKLEDTGHDGARKDGSTQVMGDAPHGLSLTVLSAPLRTEAEGDRTTTEPLQRGWKIANDNVRTSCA